MQYNYVKNQKLFDMIINLSYFSRLTSFNRPRDKGLFNLVCRYFLFGPPYFEFIFDLHITKQA